MTVELAQIKATPREGMTLQELADKMPALNYEVIETNREENFLLLKVKT